MMRAEARRSPVAFDFFLHFRHPQAFGITLWRVMMESHEEDMIDVGNHKH